MATTIIESKTCGPGYASPKQAFTSGVRERLLYVTCVDGKGNGPDYLSTVDVDHTSPTYSKVVHRTYMKHLADELHHSGWNTCSSCYGDCSLERNKLILPCLKSNRIYVLHVDGQKTKIEKVIEPDELLSLNLSGPHTSHCLPNGHVMVSCMGDAHGNNQGSFLLINGKSFKPISVWNKQLVKFGYDYWYQPRLDILVSSEWSAPNTFRQGFSGNQIENLYGHCIHLWQFSTGKLMQTVDLRSTGKEACMPLEIRMLHDPCSCVGFVACAYSCNVFRFQYDSHKRQLSVEEVIVIKPKQVDNFQFGQYLPALLTDLVISMNDQYMLISAWAFGEVRQYGQLTSSNLSLLAIIRLGGLLSPSYALTVIVDHEPIDQNKCHYEHKNIAFRGGAQMLQLSLDGQRAYVTNSLFSVWDQQFYPQMIEHGSQLVKLNIQHGSLELDPDFMVNFGDEPNGPALAHEMRYPGGDCTSDIWI